jgi:porphobilinogen synthase
MEYVFNGYDLIERPRRLRRSEGIRRMARETRLSVDNLVAPLFVVEGEGVREAIEALPGQHYLSVDRLVKEARELHELGIPAVALFPKIPDADRDPQARAALDPDGLFPRAIQAVREHVPGLLVISDVALDPYNSDGHDGLVEDGRVLNDETLEILAEMAIVHAEAGADIVAPSDMMDGRVGIIREALDEAGYEDTAILAYSATYASGFYGPFREAVGSEPRRRPGVPKDKKTYQMDPANAREAVREVLLDVDEGADMVMVKPAVAYLDVIHRVRQEVDVPLAAFHTSGEYAMIMAAAERGWLDERTAALETTTAIRRAGADIILTYFARKLAGWLRD